MTVFTILSGVMSAKFIVEKYEGNKAILLFSYPISRKKILGSKILLVFSYIAISMFLCNVIVFGIFFVTESLFHLCPEILSATVVLKCLATSLCYSLLAGLLGSISLWFGFVKKSTSTTIVAAVIISMACCQVMTMSLFSTFAILGILFSAVVLAVLTQSSLFKKVDKMEV